MTWCRWCRFNSLFPMNCYLSTNLSRHIFPPLFLLLLSLHVIFQGSIRFCPWLLPSYHGHWWSLYSLHIFTYSLYWPRRNILSYNFLLSGNLQFYSPQSYLLQILPNMWVQLTSVWLPPRFTVFDTTCDPILEASQFPQEAGLHDPHLHPKEENWLYHHFEENRGHFIIRSLPSQNTRHPHPFFSHLTDICHNCCSVIIIGRQHCAKII